MSYGVEEGAAATAQGKVYMQNRPNPFRTNTLLEYNVPVSGKVTLKVYNSLGQEVAKLVDEYKSAGTYTFNWNGIDRQDLALPKGVYFAKLQVGTTNATRKIIVQ
jgi:flagellar hook assembly protein FlgD